MMITSIFYESLGPSPGWRVHPGGYDRLVTISAALMEAVDRLENARILEPITWQSDDQDKELYGLCLNALFDSLFEEVVFARADSMQGIEPVEPDPQSWLAPALLPTSDNYVARRMA